MKLYFQNKLRFTLILFYGVLLTPVQAQTVADPPPYAVIANPLPDTMDHQKRDSVNLKFSRVRVNQAGYRPQDENCSTTLGHRLRRFP
jgi:hypothetical protein